MQGEDNISKIKERVDVVDLIGSYIKLTKSGVNYKAQCPFHNERSPSFYVSPERQIWHCFGCSLGGDIFGFVKQIDGVEFPEALRILAARAGVTLSHVRPEQHSNKAQLYEISELAAKFYEKQLRGSTVGKEALAYLHDRGVTDESIKKFRLGYAPESWQGLGDFLTRSFKAQDVMDAGLLVRRENGPGQYDRFRSRIMFPIFDLNGAVVGFAGRIFKSPNVPTSDVGTTSDVKASEPAKYVNTPQTPIYDKGRLLYGLNFAKLDMRRNNRCLVVEGNVDVIMSHQAGVVTAVASSGTALTDGHLRIIKRYTDNLDLCFDADSAGTIATDRGVDLALAHGFNVGVVAINEPDVKDPADFVKKHGAGWAEYSAKSRPFLDFYFNKFRASLDLASALGKKLFAQKLLPFVASLGNHVEQAHWVNEIATTLKLGEDVIRAEMASVKMRTPASEEVLSDAPTVPAPQLTIQEQSLLALLIKKPVLMDILTASDNEHLSDGFKASLALMRSGGTSMDLDIAHLKAEEFWNDMKDTEFELECKKLLFQIKRRILSAQLESLQFDIRAAEQQKDAARLSALVGEFSKLSRELGQSI